MPVAVMGSENAGAACAVLPVLPEVLLPEAPVLAWLRLPRVPASTAAVRLVVTEVADWPPGPPWPVRPDAASAAMSAALRRRRALVPTTLLTLGTAAAVAACAEVSGSPPPSKPWPPAGFTVRTVPTEAFSSATLPVTAWLATSRARASPMATASTATTAAVLTLFRKALPTLRARTLTVLLVFLGCLWGYLLPDPMPGAGPTVVRAAVRTSPQSYVSAVKRLAAGKVTAKVPAGAPPPAHHGQRKSPGPPLRESRGSVLWRGR
ncbi:hypothetical protein SRABI128_06194 [Microbacterium sp. Bi128]|nr:hypothetical protein SRABI128_06194 [Microbacterium sp. Bi128]